MSEENKYPPDEVENPMPAEVAQVMCGVSVLNTQLLTERITQSVTQGTPRDFLKNMLTMEAQSRVATIGLARRFMGENALTIELVEVLKEVYGMDYFQIEEYLEADRKIRDIIWEAGMKASGGE